MGVYKSFLYSLFALISFNACHDSDQVDHLIVPDIPIEKTISVVVKDANGADLFDQSSPNSIHSEGIRIYALSNGKEILCGGASDSAPYNIHFWNTRNDNGDYSAIAYLVNYPDNGYSTEIIKWNETLTDTVKCELDSYNNIQKVYVNGKLVQDRAVDQESYYITFYH